MLFNSLTFIVFLFGTILLYWAVGRRSVQNLVLVLASFVFYAWWDWRLYFLMFGCCWINYVCASAMVRFPARANLWKWLAVGSSLGILGYFKYLNFFAESLLALAATFHWRLPFGTVEVLLPIAISFYTFQCVAYTLDVARGRIVPSRSFLDYLTFATFFPQLVAGPIERAEHLLPQIEKERNFDGALANEGMRQMLWGLVKKILIADNLAVVVSGVYGDPQNYSSGHLLIATVAFSLQIYADFSAYSDIAVGCSKAFGIRLSRNFAYPYFSQRLDEFWRRWHITLSQWFRDYVFYPLKKKNQPLMAALLVTFAVSGLWHGASWNFVVWGVLHGVGVAVLTLFPRAKERRDANDVPFEKGVTAAGMAGWAMTCLYVGVGWVFFRAETLGDAWFILTHLVPGTWTGTQSFQGVGWMGVLLLGGGLLLVDWFSRAHHHPMESWSVPRLVRWPVYTVLILAVFLWGHFATDSSFIYFQF